MTDQTLQELNSKWAQSFSFCCDEWVRDKKTDRCQTCGCVEVLHDFKSLIAKLLAHL